MSELDELRKEINEADKELVRIFEKRMNAASKIGLYKAERDLPVFDSTREEEIINRNGSLVSEELRPYFLEWYRKTIEVSRNYQTALIKAKKEGK